MSQRTRIRADIVINENGVRAVDLVVPKEHRADAFRFFERILPGLKTIDRTVNDVEPGGGKP